LFLFLCWVKAISVGSFSHALHFSTFYVKQSWKDGVLNPFFR
jgi:hypothetical protein